jgi:flagellar hook-associated protein FlgK
LAGSRGYVGGGIVLEGVYQTRDQFIEYQMPLALGNAESSAAESDALSAVSALDPDATGNLTNALGDFYASLRALAQNAGDSALRQSTVATARVLAGAFNQTATAIERARAGIDQRVTSMVGEINSTATIIADLNRRISVSISSGGSPNDLLDQRQRMIDDYIGLQQVTVHHHTNELWHRVPRTAADGMARPLPRARLFTSATVRGTFLTRDLVASLRPTSTDRSDRHGSDHPGPRMTPDREMSES